MGSDYVHTLMLYDLAGSYIFCLMVFDKVRIALKKIALFGAMISGIDVWIYIVETNMAYFCAYLAYEETYACADRLLLKTELQEVFLSSDEI